MLHELVTLLQTTAAEEVVPRPGRPLMRLLWLWATLAVLGIVLLGLIGWARRRWKAQLLGQGDAKRRKPIKDAWQEAGRRAEPPAAEELEDRQGPG